MTRRIFVIGALIGAMVMSMIGAFAQAPLKVEQVSTNTFNVAVAPEMFKKSSLEWNAKPDSWKSAQAIKLKSPSESVALSSVHPILKLVSKNELPVYAAPRAILLQGAVNFRDLGGYIAKDGKQVKWGKIYRSADVSKLTDTDLTALSVLNIKMFCDLRGPSEIQSDPDRLPIGTEWLNLPAGSEQTSTFMKYMTSETRADSMMTAFYTRTDHYHNKYKPMFDQLLMLEDDKALMFHCSAGKDRTGVGAALILYALGVKESDILKDYEATNEYRKGANEKFMKRFVDQGVSEKAALAMMSANPKYLKATFDTLDKKYGSVDNFLEQEMGLTKEKRSTLQAKFLY